MRNKELFPLQKINNPKPFSQKAQVPTKCLNSAGRESVSGISAMIKNLSGASSTDLLVETRRVLMSCTRH
jgi:hypothetical protein